MSNPIHSTGRGGAGNIGADPNTFPLTSAGQSYADGDIVREGVAGVSGRGDGTGEYSSGRGGAGNMVHGDAARLARGEGIGAPSSDVVPETATRGPDGHENFHTGRGGQGNVHRDEFGGHSHAQKEQHHHGGGVEGLVEKAKHAVGLDKKEKPGH